MAATKRNAGLTSAVPRATLNDEELVCIFSSNTWMVHMGKVLCRRKMRCAHYQYVRYRNCFLNYVFFLLKKNTN